MNAHDDTWPLKKLGDISTHKMGSTPSTECDEYWQNGDVLWATPSDLGRGEIIRLRDTARKISTAGLKAKRTEMFPCGSVLLSTTATIGNIGIADRPTYCNQQITAIMPTEAVLSEYLAYYLLRSKADLMRLGGTSTATHINQKNLSTLSIPVPPIAQQRRLADILSRAEGIVRLRREAQKKAAELIPALFLDMFGDPATNPKRWAVVPLPDVLSRPFKNGLYLPKELYARDGSLNGVEMVHMSDAFYGEVKRGRLRRVLASQKQIQEYGLTAKDLLVARRSLNFEGAAKLCGIPQSEEPLLFESSFIRLSPFQERVLTNYLLFYLNNESTRRAYVIGKITGITISGINQTSLKNIPVMVPHISVQRDFVERVEQIRSIQSQQATATEKAQATFDALLARTFGGL